MTGCGEQGYEVDTLRYTFIYFDEWNIDTINTPDYYTYLIETGSYAWASKAYYQPPSNEITSSLQVSLITPMGFEDRWAMRSRWMPEIWYDVYRKTQCDSDNGFAQEDWVVKFHGGAWTNPTGCSPTNTGILSFLCGACPS